MFYAQSVVFRQAAKLALKLYMDKYYCFFVNYCTLTIPL